MEKKEMKEERPMEEEIKKDAAQGDCEEEIKKLKEALELKTKEADERADAYLRKCADFENYKKRVEKERGDTIQFANEELLKELLPAIDNLERALLHFEESPKNGSSIEGLESGVLLTLKNLFDALKKFSVEIIKTEGEKFNPILHEALSHEETLVHKNDVVIKEVQKGYTIKGRLLRPALVIVAKEPEKKTTEDA